MSPSLATAVDGTMTVRRIELDGSIDPLAIWASSTDEYRCYFARDGFAVVGLGASAILEHADGGLVGLSELRAELHDRLDLIEGAHPFLLGGASFGTAPRLRGPAWSRFPASRFILPELLVIKRDDRAWAVVTGTADLPSSIEHLAPISGAPLVGLPSIDAEHDDRYVDLVTRAVADIQASDSLGKVVAARCLHVLDPEPFAGSPLEHAGVLARLRRRYPDCTTFGLAFGDETFFGATPERLVSRHRDTIRTMAVAGSAARGIDAAADERQIAQLLASSKNQNEHRFVVDQIATSLRSIGLDPQMPAAAGVVKLRNIAHLYTPIAASAPADGADVLQVGAALHPTPAVAGTPTKQAVDWIDKHETFDRGWYAAPIGWVDLAGDGELRVGLRSALLDPDGLHLFAGAGIVADSDPQHELAETAVKLGALVDSLTG